ncbi:MAG: hypothetical protein M3373_11080 [Gemmatimonadota bacterium]|nr:hypothetical protein [Gemmatimonadota bacterium]
MGRNGTRPSARKATSRKTTKATASKAAKSGRKRAATRTPGISRIDQESTRTHGFVVRLDYRRTDSGWRPKHTAFFGDASHGGRGEALGAAEAWARKVRRTAKAGSQRRD